MKKQILALALCLCIMLSLVPGSVFAIGERTETAYDGNITKQAIFRYESLSSGILPISANPETESSWDGATPLTQTEDLASLVMVITDVVVVRNEYWYQVEAAEGYELPAELAEKPWIFQNFVDGNSTHDTLIIVQSSALDETTPEETELDETLPEETEPEQSDEEASQPQWLPYYDYMTMQIEKILADPELYVGYEAAFDTIWDELQYAADPSVSIPAVDENLLPVQDVTDAEGNGLRIRITGALEDTDGQIWYQVEAADGCTLPDVLLENPYILQLRDENTPPAMRILPMRGMFTGEIVEILKDPVMATKSELIPTADLPVFFDVVPVGEDGYYYDLGDTDSWHDSLAGKGYRYVDADSVLPIAPEVTVAYEQLKSAQSAEAYDEIWGNLPESIREKFTEKHLTALDKLQEELNNVQYEKTVTYNGKELEVSVSGPIPKSGVELIISPVSSDAILNGGFDVKSATEIITALDIKLLREDNSEWQPAEGKYVELNIGVGALGCPDGQVVRLHHKHGERISVQDVFVVMDGKLNIRTSGFSIYLVDNTSDTSGTQVNNGGTVNMDIGDTQVLYFVSNNNNNNNGTWIVNDPTGAIHYTVHSNNTDSAAIGHNQVKARWIKIVSLKKTTTPITLTYSRGNNTETFKLNVNVPLPAAGQKKLYIKDEVNTSGCLVAAVVDEYGNEVSLEGAAFSWSRRDNVNGEMFIVPAAYERNYKAVNIARDHGGLVEARKNKAGTAYEPTTYTLKVILSDGTVLEDSYTVYYQSEIINAGFEFPNSANRNYSFFPNGYPELYWKTTAPGLGTENITKDIEYGDVTGLNANTQGETGYGVWRAADWETGGAQFAELNAEEVGALYQDIITAPHEDIEWDFAHAARPDQPGWAPDVHNEMYLVIGSTEAAQKLTNTQLNALVRQARNEAGNDQDFLTCKRYEKVTYENAEYCVWYHNADSWEQPGYNDAPEYGWAKLAGIYSVPDNQYRTRVFFVSDPDATDGNNKKAGNLIDSSSAGQYKSYIIEYYEQTYQDGKLVTVRNDVYQETGEALVYSSKPLANYDHFIEYELDYLYKILINGKNYPYDIRYSGQASLYIEKYDGTAEDLLKNGKSYAEYDIVMQVILRDTVVAVQKVLEFPSYLKDPQNPKSERVQLLTEEQKLGILKELNKTGGYKATFTMNQSSTETGFTYHQEDTAVITSRDPAGNYKGFVALGDNPELNHEYIIEETALTEIPGLKLESVTFGITRYSMGQAVENDDLEVVSYTEKQINDNNEPLISDAFRLEDDIKIADVNVINRYKEKETTIYYEAVGKGKVQLATGGAYEDAPTETLAFYSGKATGAIPQAGSGATFVGWYTHPSCEEKYRVTSADGVIDETTKVFKPNANIITADEITFYAKFDTGSIVIERENAEMGQTYVYRVTQTKDENGNLINGPEFYVTVAYDAKLGKFSETIVDVPAGTYTVTEIDKWSWRHTTPEPQTKVHDGKGSTITYTFNTTVTKPKWLNGFSNILKNFFDGGTT